MILQIKVQRQYPIKRESFTIRIRCKAKREREQEVLLALSSQENGLQYMDG